MTRETKITVRARYENLCIKYPEINAIENEDLNIENATRAILEKCWNDRSTYFTVKEIEDTTKVHQRTIYAYARKYNFKNRKTRLQ